VSFRPWLILACLFGPRFGAALFVSFYAGGIVLLAVLIGLVMSMTL
jgi:hypothetical protein